FEAASADAQAELGRQADTLQLAGRTLGYLVKKDDPARYLERGKPRLREGAPLLFRCACTLMQHYGRGHGLSELLMRHREGADLGHAGMIHQHLVHLARRYLLATAIDDLLQTPAQRQITVVIQIALVSGAKPSVRKGVAV